ncbi:unnamed protein product [Owenia fusiformis]|uniref:Uncharacterized protein n=1 Tax=Owenia fusiformis TaxID=6347 RepID=A0A8J1XWT6_OWEFU|nr:unnamed protein product [Owenia fusiformis]
MDLRHTMLSCLVLAMAVTFSSAALKCHECNTKDNPDGGCEVTYAAQDNTFLKTCPPESNVCMKTVATGTSISNHATSEETRQQVPSAHSTIVSRFCGHVDDNDLKLCYGKEAAAGYSTQCYCRTDGCNGSGNVQFTLAAIVSSLIVAFYMRV